MSARKVKLAPRNPHGIGGFKAGQAANPTGIGGFKAGTIANSTGLNGKDGKSIDLRELCRTHTRAAVMTTLEIMRDKTVSAATRLTAADNILSRGHGKPAQEQRLANVDGTAIDWNSMSTEQLVVAIARLEAALGEKDPSLPAYMTDQDAPQHVS